MGTKNPKRPFNHAVYNGGSVLLEAGASIEATAGPLPYVNGV